MYATGIRYRLPNWMRSFTKTLQAKTGIAENELSAIVYFIKELEQGPAISDAQLISFHNQLEAYYKKE